MARSEIGDARQPPMEPPYQERAKGTSHFTSSWRPAHCDAVTKLRPEGEGMWCPEERRRSHGSTAFEGPL
ncbi:hypothetical protein CCMA1212_008232 [Trichoderma ghanense]|uniref:Uncharacterized protein n=1 Tax=Trichoderma ghanense TaxID=65468 RepID=A0ABY2GVJ4_9HYPO